LRGSVKRFFFTHCDGSFYRLLGYICGCVLCRGGFFLRFLGLYFIFACLGSGVSFSQQAVLDSIRNPGALLDSLGGLVFSGNHRIPVSPYRTDYEYRLRAVTRLTLTDRRTVNLKGRYNLTFNASFWYDFAFGNIFYLENSKYSFRCIFDHYPLSKDINFTFIFEKEGSDDEDFVTIPIDRTRLFDGNWLRMSADVDELAGKITVSIDSTTKTLQVAPFYSSEGSIIHFGEFRTYSDCPALILKDLRLSIQGKLAHRWRFSEMEGNKAYDEVGDMDAKVEKHQWLIDRHYKRLLHDSLFIVNKGEASVYVLRNPLRLVFRFADRTMLYKVLTRRIVNLPANSTEYFIDSLEWRTPSIAIDDSATGLRYFFNRRPRGKFFEVKIYSLRLPILTPVQYSKLKAFSEARIKEMRHKEFPLIVVYLGVPLLLVLAYFMTNYVRKRRKMNDPYADIGEPEPWVKKFHSTNYLSVFGGLKIIDSTGVNHAESLSPLLRELLAIIIFHSRRNETTGSISGVSLKMLAETVWYNIKPENLKNNRNVAFANIRKALAGFEGLSLTVKDNEVALIYPADTSNRVDDFFTVLEYLESHWGEANGANEVGGANKTIGLNDDGPKRVGGLNGADELIKTNELALATFAGIADGGEVLPGVHSEWADSTRSVLRSKVMGVLERFMNHLQVKKEHEGCNRIADIAFVHDPLNETALSFKLRALVALGQSTEAKEFYKGFCDRYFKALKEEFPFEFDELVEG